MALKISIEFIKPVFKVKIINRYNEAIKLWSATYLPGYHSMHFRVIDKSGDKEFFIKRKLLRWTINVPDFYNINPGEYKEIDLNLNDGSWDLLSIDKMNFHDGIGVSCILSLPGDEESLQLGILKGTFESNRIYFSSLNDIVDS